MRITNIVETVILIATALFLMWMVKGCADDFRGSNKQYKQHEAEAPSKVDASRQKRPMDQPSERSDSTALVSKNSKLPSEPKPEDSLKTTKKLASSAMTRETPNEAKRDSSISQSGKQALSWQEKIEALGLEEVSKFVPNAVIELPYSSTDNVFKKDMYGNFAECYLSKIALEKLSLAATLLQKENDLLTFKIFDCARPFTVQQEMFQQVAGTEKSRYVSSPKNHSMHNYGIAVDLTLAHVASGKELDMGTGFDHFGVEAQPRHEKEMLAMNLLSKSQIANRELLRKVMYGAGFKGIPNEWWHFNALPRSEVKANYPFLDF